MNREGNGPVVLIPLPNNALGNPNQKLSSLSFFSP